MRVQQVGVNFNAAEDEHDEFSSAMYSRLLVAGNRRGKGRWRCPRCHRPLEFPEAFLLLSSGAGGGGLLLLGQPSPNY
jgi:hypothetical protein